MDLQEFIERFVQNKLNKITRHGKYYSVIKSGDMEILTYTPAVHQHYRSTSEDQPVEYVAFRLPDQSVISNANRLKYAGKKFAWGNEIRLWNRESDLQIWLRNAGAVPIPFTLFEETGTEIKDFSWVVKPVPEEVPVKETISERYGQPAQTKIVNRHFSGACIFKITADHFIGTDENYYLFDIDRQEIDHGIFNPFVTKLPAPVTTIKEAYDLLMPEDVKKAINEGKEVKRQGEFFFIKYSDKCPISPDLTEEEYQILKHPPSKIGYGLTAPARVNSFRSLESDSMPYTTNTEIEKIPDQANAKIFQTEALRYKAIYDKYINGSALPGTLGKSSSGSHSVEKYIKQEEIVFVSGLIKQARREHSDLLLNGWYIVSPNTGTISWTITGEID